MANSPQARKRAKQADVRRNHNAGLRSRARTYVKKTLAAIATSDQQVATDALREAVPILDSMVTKGIYKKNKCARLKSRLNAKIKAMMPK
ncbi:MAG: 30S ribosomal protein S20 [Gammaproteobacteria bacterium]|nr:30S ribosomal protein S20 [Gammaproteobacteria bacterium]